MYLPSQGLNGSHYGWREKGTFLNRVLTAGFFVAATATATASLSLAPATLLTAGRTKASGIVVATLAGASSPSTGAARIAGQSGSTLASASVSSISRLAAKGQSTIPLTGATGTIVARVSIRAAGSVALEGAFVASNATVPRVGGPVPPERKLRAIHRSRLVASEVRILSVAASPRPPRYVRAV